MIRLLFACGLMGLSAAASGQVLPQAEGNDPRLQTIAWMEGREVTLTAMPMTGLTVMLEPGEKVVKVAIEDEQSLEVRPSATGDSFLLLPKTGLNGLRLRIDTDRRIYPFRVHTETSLLAANLVRFTYGAAERKRAGAPAATAPAGDLWSYRIKGDRSVTPASVSDDGQRTTIVFAREQSLPAVFAIGQTGDEEVVNGYMRGDVFVIDRVYQELVFRIDKEHARAVRAARAESSQ